MIDYYQYTLQFLAWVAFLYTAYRIMRDCVPFLEVKE